MAAGLATADALAVGSVVVGFAAGFLVSVGSPAADCAVVFSGLIPACLVPVVGLLAATGFPGSVPFDSAAPVAVLPAAAGLETSFFTAEASADPAA